MKLKKILIISISLIFLLIAGIYIYLTFFFDLKSFEKTINNKVYSVSGKYISFESITLKFKNGLFVNIKNLKLLNKDKSPIFYTKKGFINIKVVSIFKRKIEVNKAYFKDGFLILNFYKHENKHSKKKNITPPNIFVKKFNIDNFNVIYKDSHLDINAKNVYLKVNNFSFHNFFKFNLRFLCLTGKNLKGNIKINGEFNFNNSFSPEKMYLKAHINGENIYGSQFYSYFIKKAHFKEFTGNIKKIDSDYSGNFKGSFTSKGIIELRNFIIQHETFRRPILAKTVVLNYDYSMDKKDIKLKKFKIDLNKKIIIKGMFNLFDYKDKSRKLILKAKTSEFDVIEVQKYSPYSIDNLTLNSGSLKVSSFILEDKNININAFVKNIKGKFKFITFDNLTGNIFIHNKFIEFKGKINCYVKKYLFKKILTINSLKSSFNFKKLKINLKKIKEIKAIGSFNIFTGLSYKNYKNIKISIDNGSLENNKILNKFSINYNNVTYQGDGEFSPKQFHLKIYTKKLDDNLLKKLNIYNVRNFNAKLELGGSYFKPKLLKGVIKFNNGNLKYKNYDFKNINGNIVCLGANKRCLFEKFSFTLNEINYQLKGKIENFINKNIEIFLNIIADGIDEEIFKIIKLKVDKIKNVKLNSNIHLKFFPQIKFFIDNCSVYFDNSSFHFLDYYLKKVTGNIFINSKNLYLNKISLIFNGINYKIKGVINDIFTKEKMIAKISINSNGIDSLILKKLDLGNEKITNLNVDTELILKFFPKLDFKLKKCTIDFLNSRFTYKNYRLKEITGNLNIYNNILSFKKLKIKFGDTNYLLNGKLLNIYNKKLLSLILNIKSNAIDKKILEFIKLDGKSIENAKLDINLKLSFYPKLNLIIKSGIIDFDNSTIFIKKPFINISKLTGKIFIKNNNFEFKNIKGIFKNGIIKINGKFENNYIDVFLSGKNFNLTADENFESIKPKNNISNKIKKDQNKNKITLAIKRLKQISEKFNGKIKFNFENIKLKANFLKICHGEIKLNNKKLSLKDVKIITSDNGSLVVKKFLFNFANKENIFILKAKIDKFNPYDFTKGKISGITKDCIIDLSSKFLQPEDFTKKLNGFIFISIKNGYIYKFTFLSNLFSILNVSQLFKFKLPELSSHGLKYKIIAGKFDVINGIFKTDKLVLLSDSINLGFKGEINSFNKKMNGEIVVQPLQTIGNVIGKIPLIGYIFGKKIILIYFEVKGTVDDPKINIQPSKTITKKTFNIFKNIFKLPKELFTNPEKIFLPGVEKK